MHALLSPALPTNQFNRRKSHDKSKIQSEGEVHLEEVKARAGKRVLKHFTHDYLFTLWDQRGLYPFEASSSMIFAFPALKDFHEKFTKVSREG